MPKGNPGIPRKAQQPRDVLSAFEGLTQAQAHLLTKMVVPLLAAARAVVIELCPRVNPLQVPREMQIREPVNFDEFPVPAEELTTLTQ